MRYGLEYVLYGHIEDKVNVSISADMLLLLRMGVNFISLLTDSAARGFARETALTLCGFHRNSVSDNSSPDSYTFSLGI